MQHLWVVGPICPEEPFGIEAAPAPSPLSALSLLALNRPPVFAMLAEIEGTWSASLPVPNWAVSAPAFSSQQSLPQADGDTAVQVWVGAQSPPSCTDPIEDGNGSVWWGLQNGTGGGVPEPSHIPVPRVPGTEFILPGALGPLQLHRDPKWGEGWDPAYPHRGGAGCRGGQTRGTGRRAMPSGVMQGHGSAQRGEPGGGEPWPGGLQAVSEPRSQPGWQRRVCEELRRRKRQEAARASLHRNPRP